MLKSILVAFAVATLALPAFAGEPESEQKPDRVIYQSPGKPSHPIQVEFDWEKKAKVGQDIPVSVRIHSGMPIHDIQVVARTTHGLSLHSQVEQQNEKAGKADEKRMNYRVTPLSDGVHDLVLKISARHADRVWTREVTLQLPVGDAVQQKPTLESTGTVVEAADGVREKRVRAKGAID